MFDIFCDGGCDNFSAPYKGSNCFVVLQDKNLVHEHGEAHLDTTSNRMEYTAALNAIDWVHSNYGIVPMTIYTDSQLLVNTFEEWMVKWKAKNWKRPTGEIKNLDLVKSLYQMKRINEDIKFKWVRGHSGVYWNEYVDQKCTGLMRA